MIAHILLLNTRRKDWDILLVEAAITDPIL